MTQEQYLTLRLICTTTTITSISGPQGVNLTIQAAKVSPHSLPTPEISIINSEHLDAMTLKQDSKKCTFTQ